MTSRAEIASFSASSGDEWEHACSHCFVPLAVERVEPEFTGELCTAFLPQNVHIAKARSASSLIFRGERKILQDPRDNLLFSFYLAGSGGVRQYGREVNLVERTGSFYYSESPYSLRLNSSQEQLVVQVDRSSLQVGDSDLRSITACRIDESSSSSLRLLLAIAGEALRVDAAGSSDRREWEALSEATLILLRSIVDTMRTSEVPDFSQRLGESRLIVRRAAMLFMDTNYTDPHVDPKTVADRLHISRRYLYQVLDDISVTPATYLRDLRLSRAKELLSAGFTVDVAWRRAGFSSITTFRRAFKKKYELAPSMYRVDRR